MLMKLPKYKLINTNILNRQADLNIPALDPPDQSQAIYEFVQAHPYQAYENAKLLGKGIYPIVGNLAASREMLGLLDDAAFETQWKNIPRGSRKFRWRPDVGPYTIWEHPDKYFGKPGNLCKPANVVLIRGLGRISDYSSPAVVENTYDIPLRDRLDSHYDLFCDLNLQVILDESRNGAYTPYSYGIPTFSRTQPFVPEPWTEFTGCNLLIIFFHANHLPAQNVFYRRDLDGSWGVQAARASYFYYQCGFATNGVIFQQPFYSLFTNVQDDIRNWLLTGERYMSRRSVHHFPDFPFNAQRYIAALNRDTFAQPLPHIYADTPPWGSNQEYFPLHIPQGPDYPIDCFWGRYFYYNDGPFQSDNDTDLVIQTADMEQAIIEDILSFYSN